jgi:hypothetical protein
MTPLAQIDYVYLDTYFRDVDLLSQLPIAVWKGTIVGEGILIRHA